MAITAPAANPTRSRGHAAPRRLLQAAPAASDAPVGRDYWLAHCEGYRVDGSGGRVGFVEEVRGDTDAKLLAIRAGWLGRRVVLVPVEDVDVIVPRIQRIWLRTPATSVGSVACATAGSCR